MGSLRPCIDKTGAKLARTWCKFQFMAFEDAFHFVKFKKQGASWREVKHERREEF
jgi:hypothetical protein